MHRCPQCNSERIRRSKRRGFVERVPLTTLFLKPFHCGDCQHRFFRWPTVSAHFNAIRAKLFSWRDVPLAFAMTNCAESAGALPRTDGSNGDASKAMGLLFGVNPEADYPVCDLSIHSGDRSLFYTDGVTEPQNASGDSFVDRKLEQVVRDNQCRPPSELSEQLLSEIRVSQSASVAQQDDITLIVIDVFEQENCSKHDVGELAAEHCEKLVSPPNTAKIPDSVSTLMHVRLLL